MSRRDASWLDDILQAIEAIDGYLAAGSLDEGVVYDACRARLMEIGEAAKHLDPQLLKQAPGVRWRAIAGMRDRLAHHYFDTDRSIVEFVVREQLPELRSAVVLLLQSLRREDR